MLKVQRLIPEIERVLRRVSWLKLPRVLIVCGRLNALPALLGVPELVERLDWLVIMG